MNTYATNLLTVPRTWALRLYERSLYAVLTKTVYQYFEFNRGLTKNQSSFANKAITLHRYYLLLSELSLDPINSAAQQKVTHLSLTQQKTIFTTLVHVTQNKIVHWIVITRLGATQKCKYAQLYLVCVLDQGCQIMANCIFLKTTNPLLSGICLAARAQSKDDLQKVNMMRSAPIPLITICAQSNMALNLNRFTKWPLTNTSKGDLKHSQKSYFCLQLTVNP